jgi:hypothetical protein
MFQITQNDPLQKNAVLGHLSDALRAPGGTAGFASNRIQHVGHAILLLLHACKDGVSA